VTSVGALVDVIVVGAGIVGAACAFELARAGASVLVLERGAANREGSGTTEGNFHIQALSPRPHGRVRDSARWIPLQVAASKIWSTLEDELEESIGVRRVGGMSVAENEEQLDIVRMEHQLEVEGGIHTQLFDGDQARDACPLLSDTVVGAVYTAEDGFANALLTAPAYLRAAQRRGAHVFPFTEVTGILRDGAGFSVSAGDRKWLGDFVVDAAGPWLDRVAAAAGRPLSLMPVALQQIASERVPATLQCLVQVPLTSLIIKQVAAGNVLVGGGWAARSLDLEGRSPLSVASIAGNLRVAARVLPFVRGLRALRAWTGPYAVTPDELPVVGELSDLPGFYVAGGPLSFTHGPTWGKVVRDLVTGRPPIVDVSDLGPDRLLTS
jgi:sarcosine oxidase, subunit beta